MACIQDSPYPLVYRVTSLPEGWQASQVDADERTFRTTARALEGMQKEALVHEGSRDTAWRASFTRSWLQPAGRHMGRPLHSRFSSLPEFGVYTVTR